MVGITVTAGVIYVSMVLIARRNVREYYKRNFIYAKPDLFDMVVTLIPFFNLVPIFAYWEPEKEPVVRKLIDKFFGMSDRP